MMEYSITQKGSSSILYKLLYNNRFLRMLLYPDWLV